jgi:acetyl-CoA decarbonylase/synthase complex subunit beta
LMSMFSDMPVDVGVIYEGERIRRPDMYVEFGGLDVPAKFELARARGMDEVEDGKVRIIGPDLKELNEGGSYPLGILIEVAGKQVEPDLEGVIERRIHAYCNYVEGLMHLNQRYDIWIRLSKKSFRKGLNSLEILGKILVRLFKSELPIIEKIQVTFITDPSTVEKMLSEAKQIYEARDARARGLKDEEVDSFYGCILCQSFAPTHVCIITPQRYANCGAISWFDGRASARIDPKGPVFRIERGEILDPLRGEFSGVNEAAKEKTLGEITRVYLYSAFGFPHTSCGCFEATAFYIPEVDGLGIVDRGFTGVAVNGLPFSTMADSTAGGRQIDGFHGLSIEYMRSPKFLQADGGWERVAWVPAKLKEKVKDYIPKHLIDKIATENDVKNIDELKTFLQNRGHPLVERWAKVPAEAAAEVKAELPVQEVTQLTGLAATPTGAVGFRIILKDAKITARKLIIKTAEKRA